MPGPEIVSQLTLLLMEIEDSNQKKRTKKDYSLRLKPQIIQKIEQGSLTRRVLATSTTRTW